MLLRKMVFGFDKIPRIFFVEKRLKHERYIILALTFGRFEMLEIFQVIWWKEGITFEFFTYFSVVKEPAFLMVRGFFIEGRSPYKENFIVFGLICL
jgi:hypothetical protein